VEWPQSHATICHFPQNELKQPFPADVKQQQVWQIVAPMPYNDLVRQKKESSSLLMQTFLPFQFEKPAKEINSVTQPFSVYSSQITSLYTSPAEKESETDCFATTQSSCQVTSSNNYTKMANRSFPSFFDSSCRLGN